VRRELATRHEETTMDTMEALETCRAIRYLKPDPVPEELIQQVIYGATRASSPGNSQAWDFLVITDHEVKQGLQDLIAPALEAATGAMDIDALPPSQARMLRGSHHLAHGLTDVPVLIVVCARAEYPPQDPQELYVWSAVYPASQNLIVAARALGLGTTFTTFHSIAEPAFRELLGIPDEVYIGTVIAMGYPDRPFGPVQRKPIDEVIHRDRW
jgi:nitroreductase